jgi:hypothetical protein
LTVVSLLVVTLVYISECGQAAMHYYQVVVVDSLSIDTEQPSVLPKLHPPSRGVNDTPSSVVAVTGVMALSDQGEINAEADPMDGSCGVVGSK